MQQPLIISARLAEPTQQAMDTLRYRYFPKNRYVLPAHLTLFHALPYTRMAIIKEHLQACARQAPPKAALTRLRPLGRGFAVVVEAPALVDLHTDLRQAFAKDLTPQDNHVLHPHITLQNKVDPVQARTDQELAQHDFVPTHCSISSLCLWQYQGGPWDFIQAFHFQALHDR
jgi:2'-5' RNA ligase